MIRHSCKSLSLFVLFLAGLVSMAAMPGCVVSEGEETQCELGAGEGACDEEESAEQEAPSQEDDADLQQPSIQPQAWCSPFCDRI